MNAWKSCIAFIVMIAVAPLALAHSVSGNWTTTDPKTGHKKALVHLQVSKKGTLSGTIVKVYKHAGNTAKCTHCTGAFKDKPVKGMHFVWGLKSKGHGKWVGGKMINPKTGTIFNVNMALEGKKLVVRAHKDHSHVVHKQVWVR